jgi:hypothetical protein
MSEAGSPSLSHASSSPPPSNSTALINLNHALLTLTISFPSLFHSSRHTESDSSIASLAAASSAAAIIFEILQQKLAEHKALAAAALEAAVELLPAQIAAAQRLRDHAHRVKHHHQSLHTNPTPPPQRVLLHAGAAECLSVSSTAHRVGCLWQARAAVGSAAAPACNVAAVAIPHINQMPSGRQWYEGTAFNRKLNGKV